jgi:SAM-dependent methyltransferase
VAGPEPMHANRARAESFGAVAANYDRYRPEYPEPLIEDLLDLRPGDVLDIGCGTGKAARQLVARGLSVLGVEIDPEMAAVARAHGLPVEVAGFEQWQPEGRTFDLIVCGQAWHWIDPAVGPAKAAGLLRPGGVAALFWNHATDFAPGVREVLDEVYRAHAPELLKMSEQDRAHRESKPYLADLKASGAFGSIETKDYAFERTYTADEWVGTVGTHSDHLQLEPGRRAALADALRDVIDRRLGGTIKNTGGTYSIWARP